MTDILTERRNAAVEYMKKIVTPVWRAGCDVLSTQAKDTRPEDAKSALSIKAGRLYKGVHYSYAGGTAETFFEFVSGTDEKGIPVVTGLSWDALSGGSDTAYIGTDCSGAVQRSWAAAGADIPSVSTLNMCPDNGYLFVGKFNAPTDRVSSEIIKANAPEVMYESYALLQKADAIVCRNSGSGHTRLVVGVNTVRSSDGTIDPEESCVETLEQTRGNIRREKKYFDEKLGEDVYIICGNVKYSFANLYETGYMPVTCKAFTDPSPIPEPNAEDSLTEYSLSSLFKGTITANRLIDAMIMTVTDTRGNTKRMVVPARRGSYSFDMENFTTLSRSCVIGSIDPDSLAHGKYHCKLVCRLTGDVCITLREFDYEV